MHRTGYYRYNIRTPATQTSFHAVTPPKDTGAAAAGESMSPSSTLHGGRYDPKCEFRVPHAAFVAVPFFFFFFLNQAENRIFLNKAEI